ncbi:hypothetical protein PROFUN_10870 [Planoprotostelium fungivorum]|uniref:J domain-containing protein n=1 Tax=Planoprotostelium fungivorum TaxID=1890364 RepID=A0A2P6NC38_9EUKA|nr:hypothetical protein PROFUN_10870 [Planoprotostelium fungivorum]
MTTRAEHFRQLGNKYYMSLDPNLSPTIFIGRAGDAINAYRNSLLSSENDGDRAKALKNIGMTHLRTYEFQTQKQIAGELNCLRESAIHFYKALSFGQITREWHQINLPHLERILADMVRSIEQSEDGSQRVVQWLTSFLDEVSPVGGLTREKVLSLYTCVIDAIIRRHVRCLEDGDFMGAAVIKDCNRLLVRAACFCQDKELDETRDSVHLQQSLMESLQLMRTANEMLHHVLEQETLSMDMIWEILDIYKRVIVLTHERLLEVEAEAYSHTARIFRVIFHDNNRAKAYYRRCIHLCLSMSPKMMDSHAWYQECIEANIVFQQEEDRLAEEVRLRDTEVLREELKAELSELDGKRNKSVQKIFEWLLERHPPRNVDVVEKLAAVAAPGEVKKYLLKMIRLYHPDKNEGEDAKWRYLCGQITSLLNEKFANYKSE